MPNVQQQYDKANAALREYMQRLVLSANGQQWMKLSEYQRHRLTLLMHNADADTFYKMRLEEQ
jgi:hypothetical protein